MFQDIILGILIYFVIHNLFKLLYGWLNNNRDIKIIEKTYNSMLKIRYPHVTISHIIKPYGKLTEKQIFWYLRGQGVSEYDTNQFILNIKRYTHLYH